MTLDLKKLIEDGLTNLNATRTLRICDIELLYVRKYRVVREESCFRLDAFASDNSLYL